MKERERESFHNLLSIRNNSMIKGRKKQLQKCDHLTKGEYVLMIYIRVKYA